ncbi:MULTISPECIES: PepSY domain-containing protein [Sporosarcina]|uniref:Peptidase propeptide and YPEB domain-containing protein n=1 Tax=Sporosarcina newyorkensis TaxID=759851 RepID=A0A1T4YYX0_9BACL|nr:MULTISPECIES: PepSY domain-containing protein [Sporosarcina]SKB06465.1 Peptidase propeptide and YPEB domain-containing protein [Sporosarcina newyorkensis]
MNQQREGQNPNWVNHWQHPQYRRISMEQANEIALRQVPGQVVKAELEYDDGILIYEIDIRNEQGHKYEVKVDAVTGEVLRVKLD